LFDDDPEGVSAVEKDLPGWLVRDRELELTAFDAYEQGIAGYRGDFIGPRVDSDYAEFVVFEFAVGWGWWRWRWLTGGY
jgi:hypothetical protein